MRIAIFTNNYLPNPYGVSMSIETFRHDFEKLGHQVFIFAPNWQGYQDNNKNVFRYPSLDFEIKIRFPLAIPYSHKIDKILEDMDLDVIHAQHPTLLGSAAMKWANKKNIPLVFTWHTLYDHYTGFVPFVPSKISAGYMIHKAVNFANKSDEVVAPTASIEPILRDWGVKKEIVPIPTGVVEEDFQNADQNMIREKYGVKDDEILLLVVTRLTKEKNVRFLFKAVTPVLKKNKKVKFLAAAGGYMMEELKKYIADEGIEDQVIFADHVDNDIKKHYFAAGDIFVFASKSETQGMVISEAMYMGLPVVAVSATGSKSLVQDGKSGFLVEEEKDKFADKVEELVKDKDLRQKFSAASVRIAQENFTSTVCAKRMLEVYEKCLNH